MYIFPISERDSLEIVWTISCGRNKCHEINSTWEVVNKQTNKQTNNLPEETWLNIVYSNSPLFKLEA
jgi:hypothetical protein